MQRFIALFVLLCGMAIGQEDQQTVTERGVPTEVAPGVTIIIDPARGDDEVVLAEEVYVAPLSVTAEIPLDRQITSIQLELSSRSTTDVVVEASEPQWLIARGNEQVRLPAGARITVGFTAYAPHSGVIRISNVEGRVLHAIPYEVAQESRFGHTVGAAVSTEASYDFAEARIDPIEVSVGYQVREKVSGVSGTVSVDYDGTGIRFSGSIRGAHSW